jgi:hypothetical protein
MDSKKDIKPAAKVDALADLNLATLMQKRAELVEKQKEAAAAVQTAKAGHFLRFWLSGGAMFLAALWLGPTLPDASPISMFVLSAFIIFWLGLWIAAFFSGGAVRHFQDKATAAAGKVAEIDLKIAFCHQVLEEAKKVRVQMSAQALVEKEAAAKKAEAEAAVQKPAA